LRERHALAPAEGVLEERYRELIEARYPTGARLKHGAHELFAAAARRGIPVIVVTSAERLLAEACLKSNGVFDCVSCVVTAEGLSRSKPDPAIYLRALEKANVSADGGWALEDSPNGISAATAAGLRTFDVRVDSLGDIAALLDCPEVECERVSAALTVALTDDALALSEPVRARIDTLWAEEQRAHPNRFDGTLLTFAGRSGDTLYGRFVPYRYYLAQRRDPEIARALGLVPLAVSGIVECDGAVAFATRGDTTTQYPGWIELVPSGGIGAEFLRADKSVDYAGQLVQELVEELGVPESAIAEREPIALLRDHRDEVIDIGCVLRVSAAARREVLTSGEEYHSLRWVPIAELPQFVTAERDRLVPTSRALAEEFLKLRRARL
jgi:HAD superfamily hydrolase (TIGR01509 family)